MENELKDGISTITTPRDVIVFMHYYLPGFESGGPLRSLANMVELLGGEFNFHIVTCRHDLLDRTPYPGIPNDCWVSVGRARVWYMSGGIVGAKALFHELRRLCGAPLYLNSLFDPGFSLVPLILARLGLFGRSNVVVAPRGELSPGALQLKRIKKRLFLAFANALSLYRNVHWHASTKMEQADIANALFGGQSPPRMNVACDLVLPAPRRGEEPPGDELVFLSRISRKKNLDYALRALACCRESLSFHIYGTIEDEIYWKECQALIRTLPAHVRAIYQGPLAPADVAQTLSRHGLFFFPTRGENYGHVIAEALAAGLPVLLSDQTPWSDVATNGAGWALPLDDLKEFARIIDSFVSRSSQERARMAEGVRLYAENRLYPQEHIEDSRRLFAKVLSNTR
ncbi:MAG: glycosyltransferase [Proteobacteria bacterium]|nr:MAG: glycosyltransferase [Pseudomonadota bacterium]